MTVVILPTAATGDIDATPLERIVGRLMALSRSGVVLTTLTGGYLTGTTYTTESLLNTANGNLILAALLMWVIFAIFVEIGRRKLVSGLQAKRVRAPVAASRRSFQLATGVSILLLVDIGLLTANMII
ncbi:CopD family protein [Haloquadratum walsbyi]|nr:CopD family protein [Haloquadratum walsbyi]